VRIAVQLAVPVVIGLVLAFQAGSGNSGTVQAPLGAELTGVDGMTSAESGCRVSNAVKLGAFVRATILLTNPVTVTVAAS
jgi:hypothetical protein